jgi:hypothetical protein
VAAVISTTAVKLTDAVPPSSRFRRFPVCGEHVFTKSNALNFKTNSF